MPFSLNSAFIINKVEINSVVINNVFKFNTLKTAVLIANFEKNYDSAVIC